MTPYSRYCIKLLNERFVHFVFISACFSVSFEIICSCGTSDGSYCSSGSLKFCMWFYSCAHSHCFLYSTPLDDFCPVLGFLSCFIDLPQFILPHWKLNSFIWSKTKRFFNTAIVFSGSEQDFSLQISKFGNLLHACLSRQTLDKGRSLYLRFSPN